MGWGRTSSSGARAQSPWSVVLKSCVRIQAIWRGKAAVCRYQRKRELRESSATSVQAAFRAYKSRVLDVRARLRRASMATRVQAAFRSCKSRVLDPRAAMRVQAAFRSFKSRVLDARAMTKSRLIAKALSMSKAAADEGQTALVRSLLGAALAQPTVEESALGLVMVMQGVTAALNGAAGADELVDVLVRSFEAAPPTPLETVLLERMQERWKDGGMASFAVTTVSAAAHFVCPGLAEAA